MRPAALGLGEELLPCSMAELAASTGKDFSVRAVGKVNFALMLVEAKKKKGIILEDNVGGM